MMLAQDDPIWNDVLSSRYRCTFSLPRVRLESVHRI